MKNIFIVFLIFSGPVLAEVKPSGCFEYQVINRTYQGCVEMNGPEKIIIAWDQTSPWPYIDYGIADKFNETARAIKATDVYLENLNDGYKADLTLKDKTFEIKSLRSGNTAIYIRTDC